VGAPSAYRDRADAGRVLADELGGRVHDSDPVVLGLPRGGVPVAAPIADRLDGQLDVMTVRKIGAPHHVELAIGAVASGRLVVLNDDVIRQLGVRDHDVDRQTTVALRELAEQERRFRGDRPMPALGGRTVVLVDDGLATGATMRAAVRAVRTAEPARVIVAVPVGPPDTCAELAALADELVCPLQPASFSAVGQWYLDFNATTDEDVLRLLRAASEPGAEAGEE
jgi:putative phosphoribosyl transferase